MELMKKLVAYIAFFILTSCLGTPYQPSGFTGGYSELQIGKNRYKITFKGNAYTGSETVENRAMLRAAEFTLELGKDLFSIIEERGRRKIGSDGYGNVHTKHGTTLEIKVFNFTDYFPNTNFSKSKYKDLIEQRNNQKGDTNLYIAEDTARYLQGYKK